MDKHIVKYFKQGLTHKEILAFLLERHEVIISLSTLKRILHEHKLKRKNTVESPIELICFAVIE